MPTSNTAVLQIFKRNWRRIEDFSLNNYYLEKGYLQLHTRFGRTFHYIQLFPGGKLKVNDVQIDLFDPTFKLFIDGELVDLEQKFTLKPACVHKVRILFLHRKHIQLSDIDDEKLMLLPELLRRGYKQALAV